MPCNNVMAWPLFAVRITGIAPSSHAHSSTKLIK